MINKTYEKQAAGTCICESGPDAALNLEKVFCYVISNKIYNVLGGVTPIIIASVSSEVCINFIFFSLFFYAFCQNTCKSFPNYLTIRMITIC